MRILFKLLMKLLMLVAITLLMSSGLKHGTRFFTGGPGLPGAAGSQVTSEESDLMTTVMKSALSLLSGKATRSELADDLSDKLYGQRGDAGDMSELGIDLVKAKKRTAAAGAGANPADPQPDAKPPAGTAAGRTETQPAASGAGPAGDPLPATELVSAKSQGALAELWQRMKPFIVELSLVPVVLLGMVLVSRVRRRKREASFVPEFEAMLPEADCETYEMKHPVHSLTDEEFELVAAMIYQRQGYRVSLPLGLGGGRNGNFKLARKSERLLVRCEKMDADHRVPVEIVRELHDAIGDAGATGGLYVASCGFTWDARHFAKTRRIKLISARTLDALLAEARATPDEDLLAITPWLPKFMTKVELTTPHCPECEVEMEQVKAGEGSEWLCSQRPECSGRRAERKYRKAPRPAAQDAGGNGDKAAPECTARARSEPSPQPQSQRPVTNEASGQQAIEAVGSIPPAAPKQQGNHLPVTQPATPKPAPSLARNGGAGRIAGSGSPPPITPRRQAIHLPVPQPATPKPAPPPGSRRTAAAGSIPPTAPPRRGFRIVEAPPAKPTPGPAQAAGAGRIADASNIPPTAPPRRGFRIVESPPVTPKPAPGHAQKAGTGRIADVGNTPPAVPKRRGFRLPENERVIQKPAPNRT